MVKNLANQLRFHTVCQSSFFRHGVYVSAKWFTKR